MNTAFIVDGIRSPIGNLGGALAPVRADDLVAHVMAELMKRNASVPKDAVYDVVMGCANQAGEDNRNVARMALLLAGLPTTVPGMTINRLCASGLSATAIAAQSIMTGDAEVMIAGGVEQMTRAPFVMGKASKPFQREIEVFDTSLGWRFVNPKMKELYGVDSMGQTAENLAEQWKISRADQDAFAERSQKKAAAAREKGRFKKEIAPVSVPKGKGETILVQDDEFIRPDTSLETLGKLKPVFRTDGQGSVTAGNSSGLNDGACALLLVSEAALKKFNLKPLAKIVGYHVAGVEPRIMGVGPVPATLGVLAKTKLTLDKLGAIELNEAFAAQSLACLRELKLADDDSRVNPNGGAIALGHPLGMSGARLVLTAMHELQDRNEKFALCTMCIGVGQGAAMIIERV